MRPPQQQCEHGWMLTGRRRRGRDRPCTDLLNHSSTIVTLGPSIGRDPGHPRGEDVASGSAWIRDLIAEGMRPYGRQGQSEAGAATSVGPAENFGSLYLCFKTLILPIII